MKTLAIFGDSFGVDTGNRESWVHLLKSQYKIKNFCESGISQYKIWKQIKNNPGHQVDMNLICHTSHSRVHVNHNPLHQNSKFHKNCDIILADIEQYTDEFSTSAKLFFKHIYNEDYYIDIYNLMSKDIDELCNNTPTLHVFNFERENLYQFNNYLNLSWVRQAHSGNINHYNCTGNKLVHDMVVDRIQQCLG